MKIVSSGMQRRVPMNLIEKLYNLKPTFVYIKMYIAFLKIGRYQTPYSRLGVSFLQTSPYLKSKPLPMSVRINIKQIQPVNSCLRVNLDNDTPDFLPICIYSQRFTLGII